MYVSSRTYISLETAIDYCWRWWMLHCIWQPQDCRPYYCVVTLVLSPSSKHHQEYHWRLPNWVWSFQWKADLAICRQLPPVSYGDRWGLRELSSMKINLLVIAAIWQWHLFCHVHWLYLRLEVIPILPEEQFVWHTFALMKTETFSRNIDTVFWSQNWYQRTLLPFMHESTEKQPHWTSLYQLHPIWHHEFNWNVIYTGLF